MLELTGMGSVLRGLGMLYWLLAIGAVALALWKSKGKRGKAIAASIAVAVFGFLPAKALIEKSKRDAYAREAWAYFKKKCETEAGEKIYKTFTGVKSVLVIKPLPPATEKDLFDQYWYGDPYSNASALMDRGERLAGTLIRNRKFLDSRGEIGFSFFEQRVVSNEGEAYQRVEPIDNPPFTTKLAVKKPESRFGVSWEDISTPEDRKYWVAASRFRVIDLANNSLVAERIGYLIEVGFGSQAGQRRPWQTSRGPNATCPPLINGTFEDRWFILRALNPIGGKQDGK